MVQQPSYWKVLTRRKVFTNEPDGESKLNRVLGLFDLTALGVGSTLGAGVYVLAGQIAKEQAGPSVMLSFAIAAIASLLAGICYAEFGARVPKAGSAYVYSYVCIGEFVAFVIGWNLMLEYIIGTASVCRGISLYLDTLINDTLKTTFAEVAPINASFLGSYFDFFAFGLVIVFGVALAFGVETSAIANNFCTCLNIFILLFVIVAGALKADIANWSVDVSQVNDTHANLGNGGFFPFGFAGTLKGAATCFFGFVGFDCIATTGEEVRNPRKNIPRSILLSLLIIFLCYFGVSTVLTLMVPYYEQDPNAPLPYAFKEVGWMFAMWIVSVGGLIGLLASLFGALFPLPRVMYSMAEDGLLFRFLGKISPRFQVPVVGSIFAAIFTAVMAGLFDLAQLVNLLSIGTLLAYSVVAISTTILRYMDNSDETDRENGNFPLSENSMLTSSGSRITFKAILAQLFNSRRLDTPTTLSTRIVGTLITIFCLLCLGIGLVFMQAYDALIHNQVWVFILLGLLVVMTILVLIVICLQPREAYSRVFRVPFVPLVPAISIFINIYLMLQLDVTTWIRFGIWMIVGIPIFIACWCMYDIKNPDKRNPARVEFAKALRESSNTPKPTNGHLTIANMEANGGLKTDPNTGANGSVLSTQNEHSVKSLDEIMDLNEVSDELIEVKYPNGKVFYVEDTKSNTSVVTLNGDVEAKNPTGSYTTEEEKSVIAMLDDVLQAEDDGVPTTPRTPDFSRKISVDSGMGPSVIKSTTVATVHSSSSNSSENDDDLDAFDEFEAKNPQADHKRYMESRFIAQKLVDDIFSSDEFLNAWEQRNNLKNQMDREGAPISTTPLTSTNPGTTSTETIHSRDFKRTPSDASLLSGTSVEDPLHSEKFRNKLSKIFLYQTPPTPVETQKNKTKDSNLPLNESQDSHTELKHSKSENDVRQLVLKAIEGTGIDIDKPDETRSPLRVDDSSIPKPPKFDPILYKTINSLQLSRERPGLDKLLQEDEKPLTRDRPKEPELPFKQKLEAVLRRGPSHRTQKRPEPVPIRRPKSMEPISAVNLEVKNSPETMQKEQSNRLKTKSENSLNTNPAAEIINIRKSLRHIENGPID